MFLVVVGFMLMLLFWAMDTNSFVFFRQLQSRRLNVGASSLPHGVHMYLPAYTRSCIINGDRFMPGERRPKSGVNVQGVPQNSLRFSFYNFLAHDATRIYSFDIFH